MKTFIKILVVTAVSFSGASCDRSESPVPPGSEVFSALSPDGAFRAKVWIPKLSGGLGATISQSYQVWIQETSGTDKQLVLEGNKSDGFRLLWTSGGNLEICYADAQVYKFKNKYVVASETSRDVRIVEVVLRRVPDLRQCG